MSERLIWKEISSDDFFRTVGSLNVHPTILEGKYPFTSIWKTPRQQVLGKSIGQVTGPTLYFVPDKEASND